MGEHSSLAVLVFSTGTETSRPTSTPKICSYRNGQIPPFWELFSLTSRSDSGIHPSLCKPRQAELNAGLTVGFGAECLQYVSHA